MKFNDPGERREEGKERVHKQMQVLPEDFS